VLQGVDAVVHLANIPAPEIHTPATTFNQNMTMNFNVFTAAAQAKLERVVWASSETTLGLPFDEPPRYSPVDENHYPVPSEAGRGAGPLTVTSRGRWLELDSSFRRLSAA
jgi:nucleoside-diphosphate-sugar epimerase